MLFFKKTLPPTEKLTMVESLSTMLSSGIPILEALESVKEDSTNPLAQKIVSSVIEDVTAGKNLTEALGQFEESFDKVFLSVLRSGEASGKLDQVLKELAQNTRSEMELRDTVRSAMFYPSLVMGLLFVVLAIMLFFVLPRVAIVFNRMQMDLPLPTKILISISLFIAKNTPLVAGSLAAILILIIWLMSLKSTRKALLQIALSSPVLGRILKEIDLTKFSRTLSLLLNSGVPIISSFELAADVVFQDKTKSDLLGIKNKISSGKTLAEAFKSYPKTFPSLVARIISTGERSGTLDKNLLTLSEFYQNKVNNQVKNLSTLIEPILLIIIGVIVGGVIISIIAPIYQLIGQISG
ncbi:MAG: hypothetical protein A2Y57_02225, partial [Candidatus Woykebacteria bacterium RBG_13_40_7b]